jgi:hypothetical protein
VILEDKKILFIHIPKCAGVSIEKFFGWDGLRHETLQTYGEEYSYEFLESCFKFTIVRNPWARMVSWYSHHHGKLYEPKNKEGFQKWVKSGLPNHFENKLTNKTLWNKHDPLSYMGFLYNDKNIDLNYIGKVETLDEDMKKICEKIDVPYIQLPKRNSSNHADYREYYDKETKNIIKDRFIEDFIYFPYDF